MTEAATTDAATTEVVTEEATTTEAVTEAATTEAVTEAETTDATTTEVTTEAITEEPVSTVAPENAPVVQEPPVTGAAPSVGGAVITSSSADPASFVQRAGLIHGSLMQRAEVNETIPDSITNLRSALASASTKVASAKVDMDANVTAEIARANALIQEVLAITSAALGVQV